MTKRFSRLKYGLAMLRTPNGTGAIPDAPANTIAKEFQEFQAGKKKLTYPRGEDSKPGNLQKVSILPFYFAGEAGKETIVTQSLRADEAADLNAVQTACNQVAADLDTHIKLFDFIPAKAVVFDYTGATAKETSQITGVPYDKRVGKSYTFPYGASATEQAERNVRQDILSAVQALTTASVSFTSEKI